MAGTSLGELVYTLTLNDAGFEGQLAANKAQMKETAATADETSASSSGSFNKMGIAAAAVAVGIGIVADKTIKSAVAYQASLTELVTGAGESQKNIGMINTALLKMADTTGTPVKQLTDGLFMIESAGYHGKAGLDVLTAAAEGAKVGNADLGVVSDATTTIMKDFGSSGITASGAVNALIATVSNGKTHMQDLAGAMSQILPTASATKVSLTDVMGAMATMTGEGVPAANAATYLRQTLINLTAPGSAATAMLQSVGLTTAQVSDGMKKSLPDTLAMITDAVGKKFPAGSSQYVEAIKTISGGSKTMQGMLDLTGDHLKDFKSNVDSVSTQMKEGGKTIVGWSDVQKDAKFQQDQLKASLQTTGIAIGEMLLPAVSAIAKAVANFLKPIAEWVTTHQKLARTIIEVVAALSVMVLGIVAVTKAIEFAGTVMDLIAATNPIVLAIMAIVLVAVLIINYWSDVKRWFDDFWHWLTDNWKTVLVIFMPFLAIPMLIIANWKSISDFFIEFWKDIKQWFSDGVNWVKQNWAILAAILLGPVGIILATWHYFGDDIKAMFNDAVNFVKSVWSSIVGFFSNIISSVVHAVQSGVSGVGNWLYNAGQNLVQGFINGIENFAGKVMDSVKNIGSKAVSALKGVLKIFSPSQVFADLGANVSIGLAQGITGAGQQAIDATSNLATSVVQAGTSTPSVVNNNSTSSNGGVNYNFAGASFNFSTKDAVDEFFSIGNRSTALELAGGSPLAGTTGV